MVICSRSALVRAGRQDAPVHPHPRPARLRSRRLFWTAGDNSEVLAGTARAGRRRPVLRPAL